MTLSPKQRAKRRWHSKRTEKAAAIHAHRKDYRSRTVRYKTRFGIVTLTCHPLLWDSNNLPAPGFYDLTKNPELATP